MTNERRAELMRAMQGESDEQAVLFIVGWGAPEITCGELRALLTSPPAPSGWQQRIAAIDGGRLEAIRERAARATPGPWQVFEKRSDAGHTVDRRIGTVHDHPQLHGPEPVVTQFVSIDPLNGEAPWQGVSIQAENAAFIAAAREDVPFLLGAVDQMASEIAWLMARLESRANECVELQRQVIGLAKLASESDGAGWSKRIAAMDPWEGDAGDESCFFCARPKWSAAATGHRDGCLWQNAKDALPLLPEGALEEAFREGYDFGQADAGFDEVDASGAWRKSATGQDAKDALHPSSSAWQLPAGPTIAELRDALRSRIGNVERASDGGNKGRQCIACGEWSGEHHDHCDVVFWRDLLNLLDALPPVSEASPAKPDAFAELLSLSDNWDSYGAGPIDPRAVEAARRLQFALSVAPLSVVPSCTGGVQLEMHREGFDFEIGLNPDGSIEETFAKVAEADASPAKETRS